MQLYDDIEKLAAKPTTRQFFGLFSRESSAWLRFVTICLLPLRAISVLLRTLSQLVRRPFDKIRDSILDSDEPPPALEAS